MAFNAFMKPGPEDDLIDPLLTFSSHSCYEQYEDAAQIQRYLEEPQSTFFNPPVPLPSQTLPDQVEPFSPESQPRSSSSLSRHRPPVFSAGQSDLTDSEFCQTNSQGPATPRDVAVMSPYINHAPYEPMDQHSLAGMTSDYVNLSDISPAYDSQLDYADKEDEFDFDLGPESFFDPALSGPYPEAQDASDHSQEVSIRMDSPTALGTTYPDPESVGGDIKMGEEVMVNTDPTPTYTKPEHDGGSIRDKTACGSKGIARRGRPPKGKPIISTLSQAAGIPKTPMLMARHRHFSAAIPPRQCDKCNFSSPDDAALEKHDTLKHKRWYTCVFQFAGCTQSFNSKNEWKRHAASQHLNLRYWLCSSDDCGQYRAEGFGGLPPSTLGRPFRRKDLYTQHLRRMHLGMPASGSGRGSKAVTVVKKEQVTAMQDQAERQRCDLPTYMRCPMPGCAAEFTGETAWNDRMEHVASHLENLGHGRGPTIPFGGPTDETLTTWAASEVVSVIRRTPGGWELCEPPRRPRGEGSRAALADASCSNEDAEGEDC